MAPGETIRFLERGITIVYGDNGTGKSGYARILKRACRSRHRGKIQPNVYARESSPTLPTAAIEYSVGRVAQAPSKWIDNDSPHPQLSAISVFDSDAAPIHINEQNEVAYRPFGLDIPDELARACQLVKTALTNEQKSLQKAKNPIFLKPIWRETTVVGKQLSALKAKTDTTALKKLSELSAAELDRLSRLGEDLAKNPDKAAAEQKLRADNVARLLSATRGVQQKTSDGVLDAIRDLDHDAMLKAEAERVAAAGAFANLPLGGVGGAVWRELWEAARAYSTQIAYPDDPFPARTSQAVCVLCQQPLGDEARHRLGRFDEFIRTETERNAERASQI
ncbi:MAG: AAA family ATPase, partial [Candidatus Saccharimonadales bacterium]